MLLPVTGVGTADVTQATDDVAGVHYPYAKLVDGTLNSTEVIAGTTANGLDVDVTRLPALVAGSANIGDVDVASIAAGDNNIGNVDIVKVGTVVDPNNSTTTPLAEAATFTGTATEVLGYSSVSIIAASDKYHDVYLEHSPDGTNWDLSQYAGFIDTSIPLGVVFAVQARYARVRIVQGDTGTDGFLRAQALLFTHPAGLQVHGIEVAQGTSEQPVSVRFTGGAITVDNTTLAIVGGGVEATAQRVTLANDSTGVLSVDDNGSTLTVDAPVATPVFVRLSDGAAAITALPITDNAGTLTVDQPTGTNLHTVVDSGTITTVSTVTAVSTITNVVHVDDNASTLTVDNPIISVVGSGTEATAQRVTIATDSTGVLSVDDNGGNISIDDGGNTITVDGTVTANQGGAPWSVTSKVDLTPSSPTAASVGVATAQAVAANASRKGLVLVNTSTARISLGLGAAAVLNSGITLYPGGVFEMDEFTFDLGAVNAIASAAASNLAVQEFA